MDSLHANGVDLIVVLQQKFKDHSEAMLLLSHLADLRNAFLVYFPIAFFCRPSVGVKVMWAGVLSEWLNAMLKSVLHGERPYWWVRETDVYEEPPHLQQYPLTCETGPGSPSGHVMVTASILAVMVAAITSMRCTKWSPAQQRLTSVFLWLVLLVFMTLVGLSRCYLATHFPHQAAAGIVAGVALAVVCIKSNTDNLSLPRYVVTSAALLLAGPALYWLLEALGYNPLWSVTLAQRWCAQKQWVYLDTTVFFAVVRDAGALLGLGAGLWQAGADLHKLDSSSWACKLLAITLSLSSTRALELLRLPQHSLMVFYALAYLKYFLLAYVIVAVTPRLSFALAGASGSEPNSNGHKS